MSAITMEYRCHSRARLMRELSQHLMEAGADFSDGVSLTNAAGTVRIAPAADREALLIRADARDAKRSEMLAKDYVNLLGSFQL